MLRFRRELLKFRIAQQVLWAVGHYGFLLRNAAASSSGDRPPALAAGAASSLAEVLLEPIFGYAFSTLRMLFSSVLRYFSAIPLSAVAKPGTIAAIAARCESLPPPP